MFLGKYHDNKTKYVQLNKHVNMNDVSVGKKFELNQVDCIRKIGDMYIKTKPVIAINQWKEIDLSPGTYDAYSVDNNMMLIKKDLRIIPNESLIARDWKYTKSINSNGTETGTFGFYDLHTLKKIQKPGTTDIPEFNIMYSDDMTPGDIINEYNLLNISEKERKDYYPFAAVKLSMGQNKYACFFS
jgi:hypothetical protein